MSASLESMADDGPSGSSGSRVYVDSHRSSFASKSALVAILDSVKKHGLPETVSRKACKRARDSELNTTTPVGDLYGEIELELLNGQLKRVPIINPAALLWTECKACPAFATFMANRISEKDSSINPWRIISYCDEVLPGNPLKGLNQRKIWARYWSFAEFSVNLGQEASWFHLLALRSTIVKQLKGGVSQVWAKAALSFHEASRDFYAGIYVELGHGLQSHVLRASLSTLVGDEAALKACWSFKGAGGIVPCPLCTNIVSDSSGLVHHSPSLKKLSSDNLNGVVFNDNAKFIRMAQELHRKNGVVTKKEFDHLEKAYGITYQPCMAALNQDLLRRTGPCSSICFDWMHIFFVSGLFNSEAGWLLDFINDAPTVNAWMKKVKWQHSISSRSITGLNVFLKRSLRSGELKTSASEGLSIYGVIRGFLMTCTRRLQTSNEVRSYFALCRVVDLLLKTRQERVEPQDLKTAIEEHLRLRVVAYSQDVCVPKCHYALHLYHHLASLEVLPSCFVHERKHKDLKRFGEAMMNANQTMNFDLGLHSVRGIVLSERRYLNFICTYKV